MGGGACGGASGWMMGGGMGGGMGGATCPACPTCGSCAQTWAQHQQLVALQHYRNDQHAVMTTNVRLAEARAEQSALDSHRSARLEVEIKKAEAVRQEQQRMQNMWNSPFM